MYEFVHILHPHPLLPHPPRLQHPHPTTATTTQHHPPATTAAKNRHLQLRGFGVTLGLVVVFGAVLLPELFAQLLRLGLEPLLGHGRVDERASVRRLVLGRTLQVQRRQLPLQRALPLVLNVLDGVLQVFELVQLVTVLLVELQLELLDDAAQLGRVLFLRALNLRLELVRPLARLGVARVDGRRLERAAAGSWDALELLLGGRRGVRVHWWRGRPEGVQ